MAEHVGLPNPNELEWMILGDIYGYLQAEDRRPEGVMPRDCDPLTGLPLDQAPKIVKQLEQTPDGAVVEKTYITPGSLILPMSLARGGMALAGEMTLWAGSDDPAGGPGTPGLAADHLVRIESGGKRRRLSMIARSEWSDTEVHTWRELAYRIRKMFHDWAKLGLVDPAPTIFETPERPGLDGLPRVVRPTWRLLDCARRTIPGTKYANRPKSILHDLTPQERATQPQYARESYQKEAGGTGEVVLKDTIEKERECPSSVSKAPASEPTASPAPGFIPTETPGSPSEGPPS